MTQWLFDTLIWTAALIALVLVIRRPVAKWIGPQFAYALWLLPMARLLMPPITLPAWLAPKTNEAADNQVFLIQGSNTPVATQAGENDLLPGAGAAATDWFTTITPSSILEATPVVEIGCAVWLIGAAIFLWRRFDSYFELRDDLMRDAREVGRTGNVRLVETMATQAPLAFGVIDKVVALPTGFMAQEDRLARDLALAHEFAHHKGQDLLINVAVQPLFALHWWNPLGRYGWLALRRDQEAACDARVINSKPAEHRAAYANLIASVAAGPNVALAAPMACPVLGDKSIIHRLRSLKMSDTTPTRRWTGRLMIGAAVIALPLTASITYAEGLAPDAPPAPAAPDAPFVSVTPPAPPAPPVSPAPPAPLVSPASPAVGAAQALATVDPSEVVEVEVEGDKDKKVQVWTTVSNENDGSTKSTTRSVKITTMGEKLSDEELESIMAEVRAAEIEVKEAEKQVEKAILEIRTSNGKKGHTVVKMGCHGTAGESATFQESKDGVRKVFLCESEIKGQAMTGLKEARKAIAKNPEIKGEMREQMLEKLDAEIKKLERQSAKAKFPGV